MNEEIKALLNSESEEDIKLGVELLYRTDKSWFRRPKPGMIEYWIPVTWHTDVNYPKDRRHQVIGEYCKENNYWIYE